MLVLTEDAVLKCAHGGVVRLDPQQHWLTIEGRVVLVEGDPLGRPIAACPHATPLTPPCARTVSVDKDASYSAWVSIDGLRVCLDTTTGATDWSRLGTIPYSVNSPGQELVTIGG
jgi:hypothetical protein